MLQARRLSRHGRALLIPGRHIRRRCVSQCGAAEIPADTMVARTTAKEHWVTNGANLY